MFHAALLAMMKTTFAPWRLRRVDLHRVDAERAVAADHHDLPIRERAAPRRCRTARRRRGSRRPPRRDTCASARPIRAKLRMSPPSAMVMASALQRFAQRGEDAVRDACGRPCRRAPRPSAPAYFASASHVLVAQRFGPCACRASPTALRAHRERVKREAGVAKARPRHGDCRAALPVVARCARSARWETRPASRSRVW